jgi:hypothetical protein
MSRKLVLLRRDLEKLKLAVNGSQNGTADNFDEMSLCVPEGVNIPDHVPVDIDEARLIYGRDRSYWPDWLKQI